MESDSLEWYARVRQLIPTVKIGYRPGDWENVYEALIKGGYLTSRNGLQAAIDKKEDSLVLYVLLQAGLDPSSVRIYELVQRAPEATIRVLLDDPRTRPESEDNRAVMTAPVYRANVIDMLLDDERVSRSLTDSQMDKLARSLATPLALDEAISLDHVATVTLILSRTDLIPSRRSVLYLISTGRVEMLSAILSAGSISFESAGWMLEPLAKQKSSEVVQLVLAESVDRAFVSSLLWQAVLHDNVEIVRTVLADSRANPHLAIANLARSRAGLEIAAMLFRDRRTDVQAVRMTPQLATILEPLIANRVVSVYRASRLAVADYQSEKGSEEYVLFLQTVIVKRLTPLDSVNWLIDHPIVEAQIAAAVVVRRRIDRELTPVEMAYLGYFQAVLYGLTLDEAMNAAREEGASDLSVDLSAGLIAAALPEETEYDQVEYETAMSAVFDVDYED